jgi:alpha-galactosidase
MMRIRRMMQFFTKSKSGRPWTTGKVGGNERRLCGFPFQPSLQNSMQTTRKLYILSAMVLAFAPFAGGSEAPVKVYILSGQSNMVGIGQVDGGGSRWGREFIDPVLSIYPGEPDATADYDTMEPLQTLPLESFGGNAPTPYPAGGVHVVRGHIEMATTGVYEFRPGFGKSTENIMVVDGTEVHCKKPGKAPAHQSVKLEAGKKVPFKITYLNAQGNGLGWHARLDIPGTLRTVVNQEGKFQYLVDENGIFVPRDDVFYKGVVTATASKWLDIGCGASNNSIGPELGFGHMVGNFHDEPVLIIKASQGNRSLSWDFLPPGSERSEHTDAQGVTWVHAGYQDSPERWVKGTEPEPINWHAGKQYDDCFEETKELLANFDGNFPHWKGRGYEIAGFGWWQGHKDGGEQGSGSAGLAAMRYERNLVRLIHALREEFNAPAAPFVVATVGFGGGRNWEPGSSADTIFNAQMSVGDPAKHPDFKGTVKSVDIRGFYRPADASPRNQSFHYHGNAETYMLVGEAMGKAMVELMSAPTRTGASSIAP